MSTGGLPVDERVVAFAPGRVNLIGDHTDYTGGFAMPMTVELGTEASFLPDPSATAVEVTSSLEREAARIALSIPAEPLEIAMVLPEWGRYAAAVIALARPAWGGKAELSSDLPVGAGLSSSAALEVALALALGAEEAGRELALTCQRAEQLATGVRTGILDQLAIVSGQRGHAMLLDCGSLEVRHVEVPVDEVEFVVVDSGVRRSVSESAYGLREAECAEAARLLGPLRHVSPRQVDGIADPVIRRRARHVVSENARVLAFAGMRERAELEEAGHLLDESHRSLAIDFEVSVPELDELVAWLQGLPGVLGARLTGAGFGGCALALARPGVLGRRLGSRRHWVVAPGSGARRR